MSDTSYTNVFNQAILQMFYIMIFIGFIIGDYMTIEINTYYIHDIIYIGQWHTSMYEYLILNIVCFNFAILFAYLLSFSSTHYKINENVCSYYSCLLKLITWGIFQIIFIWNIYGVCILLCSNMTGYNINTHIYLLFSLFIKLYYSWNYVNEWEKKIECKTKIFDNIFSTFTNNTDENLQH